MSGLDPVGIGADHVLHRPHRVWAARPYHGGFPDVHGALFAPCNIRPATGRPVTRVAGRMRDVSGRIRLEALQAVRRTEVIRPPLMRCVSLRSIFLDGHPAYGISVHHDRSFPPRRAACVLLSKPRASSRRLRSGAQPNPWYYSPPHLQHGSGNYSLPAGRRPCRARAGLVTMLLT